MGTPLRERNIVAIYGAGAAGLELYESLLHRKNYQVLAFVDDDSQLQGRYLRNIPIHAPESLARLSKKLELQWVFLALPKASRQRRREILEELRPLQLGIKVLPSIDQLLHGKGSYHSLQDVGVADLLGRDEVPPESSLI